jgi:hypothetical protein
MDGRSPHREPPAGMSSQEGRNGACTEAPDESSRRRPEAHEVFAAAVELATAGSSSFRRTARRYSICAADADDAYQRSLEMPFGKVAWAYTFRDGLIVHQKLYMSQSEALEAVGLSEQDAHDDP